MLKRLIGKVQAYYAKNILLQKRRDILMNRIEENCNSPFETIEFLCRNFEKKELIGTNKASLMAEFHVDPINFNDSSQETSTEELEGESQEQ